MDIEILSLFPDYFVGPFDESILKRARQKHLLNIRHVQIREFTLDKHHKVDDRPFGGGPGMVMMPEPLTRAIRSVKKEDSHVVYLSPQGKPLTASLCKELAQKPHLILVCGHYEGIDERVIEEEVDEEISIGDYVLTNGALAAIVLVDAVSRFIPGVIGDPKGAEEDSFETGILDCPHYTRPEVFCGKKVPDVLLSGDHEKIHAWRKKEALKKTKTNRPDLYSRYLARGGSNPENSCPFEGGLEIVLTVSDLKRAEKFYKKILSLPLLDKTEDKVLFGPGITLVEGEVHKLPLLKLCVKEEILFHTILQRLMREMGKNNIIFGKSELHLSFSDPDGHEWMLVLVKGENENNGCLNSRF